VLQRFRRYSFDITIVTPYVGTFNSIFRGFLSLLLELLIPNVLSLTSIILLAFLNEFLYYSILLNE
jgi:hypothetical protein